MPCGAQMVHRHGGTPFGEPESDDERGRGRARLALLAVAAVVIALVRLWLT